MEVLRTIKGWSQEETAEKCCTGQKAYWGWEKGNIYPRKNSRRAIAHAIAVKVYAKRRCFFFLKWRIYFVFSVEFFSC